jgi:glycosyltransferase involved in cell wall biosynthesis
MADIWKKTGSEIVLLNLRGMGDIISAWKLSRIMKTGTYVIHTHNFRDAMTAAVGRLLSANQCNIRLVVTRHLVKKGKNTILYRWLYRQIDSIVFVSKIAEHSFFSGCLKIDVSKTCVIYNSIPNNRIINEIDIRKEFQIYPQIRILLYHGRINKEKGILELIQAMCLLKDYSNIKLLVIGSSFYGNTNKEDDFIRSLKEQATKIQDRILFTGFIPYDKMPEYLKISDLAVIPSNWDDPFPTTVLEAQAMGLPIITTKRGGIPEEVTEKNAILLNTDEQFVDNLASAILDLYQHPEKRKQMAKASLERSKLFDKETYAKNFFKALELNT